MTCGFEQMMICILNISLIMNHNQRLIWERLFEVSLLVRPAKIKKIFEGDLIIEKEDGNLLVFKGRVD